MFATHNRAGEITYKQLSQLTYEFTLVTYTYTPSLADRPTLDLNWGDGTESIVQRISKTNLPNQVSMNIYKGTHTFSGQGEFIISMEDRNRNGGVINIPNSINVSFYIETVLTINPFIGINNSPVLLNPPIDNGCVGYPFLHNPGAYDIDGDSIAYELIHCRGTDGAYIAGYSYPNASVSFSIDPITGTLAWINPTMIGEFNVAIRIKEYRNGVLIGTITRDMQITIANCNNKPPVLTAIADTCIEVGQTLTMLIEADDVDNDMVTLRGTGGPILLPNSPAIFPQPSNAIGYVSSTFTWTPICEHVQLYPYQMIFKAKDNGSPVNLVDIKTTFIKVIAPGPTNLLASPKGITIELIWDKSICSNADKYDIYRHNGYIGYLASNCETGVPAWTGYSYIGSTSSVNDTTFVDSGNGFGLQQGSDYCYMVVARFPDGAESYPSLEVCAQLIKDVPVVTNVSVDTTAINEGEITVIWSKPDSLDYTQTPGPFVYQVLYNNTGFGQPMVILDSMMSLNDTIFHHKIINTKDETHYYKIGFINNSIGNRFYIGESQLASSIYLSAIGKARRMELKWQPLVPWTNDTFIVYREVSSDIFDSIGYTTTNEYIDSNLVNGTTYCYYVKSIGGYSASGFSNPLINKSQISCGIPIDEEPPCPPLLKVSTNCVDIENILTWNNPNNTCADDVVRYKIYYTPSMEDDFDVLYKASPDTDTIYNHTGIETVVGCYYVTAIDSFDNESSPSNKVCVDIDSCRLYKLPNVFTPNNDGYNDLFIPFPYDFVESVEMNIYNRWGGLVFNTSDPDINWDGNDITTGGECTDGVYFFVCEVYERRLEGVIMRTINGTVSLYR
ncbi:MAG: gliding motility-associated C-terminal domain-containing protein [Bacteroidales bacterium]|nr:gliding motility-associated C-terminal domain-containing protein [Bacteroidales bacterium]